MNTPPKRLPLSVIIPTGNHSAQIPAHLTSLDRWLDLAQDVVVVDAYSADGTIELLRSGLFHRRSQFFQQSLGFHAAINFGVSQLEGEFIYVSRPGDAITRDGILHLVETAQLLGSDVLLSPPSEEPATGEDATATTAHTRARWPVEQMLAARPPAGPRLLRRTCAFYLALANALGGRFQSLLGGISSDLFRGDTLRARPFPEGAGQAGNALWVLQHGLGISFGVTPQACASFYPEADEHSKREQADLRRSKAQAPTLASEAIAAALRETGAPDAEDLMGLQRYLRETHALIEARESLRRFRQQDILWFLRPAAWRARAAATRHRRDWHAAEAWLRQRPLWHERNRPG
jgi:hypothetical protein